jgi:hypothetical protein
VGIDREHNAKALAQAKQALIGWLALNAAGTDANPGRLPCPEAPGDYGTVNEGRAAGNCTLPAVGRLPWRTLGLDKLTDAAGEPLWYVVSPGWALSNSTVPPLQTTINSDSQGQLGFEGATSLALIIAPGAAISVQAGTGCTAWAQSRPTSGAPDLRNYLECENATSPADTSFVASRAGQSFNDQVIAVRAGDVIPALEAAIVDRMQREIAPALRTVYTSAQYSGIPSSSPMYPYAAPFGNPGTSNYQGSSTTHQGLFPVNSAASMVAYQSTPANAVETLGYGYIESQSCFWETANAVRVCEGYYKEYAPQPWRPIRIQMSARFANMAMGLRAINATRYQVYARDDDGSQPWTQLTASHEATMHTDGSVTVRFWATMPNIDDMVWDSRAEFRIRIERAVIDDHTLAKSDDPTVGWLVRNQWQRMLYYATASQNTAASLSSLGCTSSNCLRFNDPGVRNIRALLILAGRSLSNPAGRPNGTLSDYVEYQNGDLGTLYEQRPVRRAGLVANPNSPWNDRVVLVDWIAPNPTFPLASLP